MNHKSTNISCRILIFLMTLLLLIYLTETAHIRKHHLKRKAIKTNIINEYVVCRNVLKNHVPNSIPSEIFQQYKHQASTDDTVEICEPLSFFPIKTSCGKINCELKPSHKKVQIVARTAFLDFGHASFYPSYVGSNINAPAKSHNGKFPETHLCEDRVRDISSADEAYEIENRQVIRTINCPLDGPSIPISKECDSSVIENDCHDSLTYVNHTKRCRHKINEIVTCTEIDGMIHNKTIYVSSGCFCIQVPNSKSTTHRSK